MVPERSFAMLKPGVLQRRIAGEVLSRIERKGLRMVAAKLMTISREQAERHYAEHAGKDFYPGLIRYMTSAPVLAFVVEGRDAVSSLRKLAGATDPSKAEAGTIRGDYGAYTSRNIIHASDSPESAAREIGLFFSADELHPWADGNDPWI